MVVISCVAITSKNHLALCGADRFNMSARYQEIYICTDRREKSPDLGNVYSRRPKEHLIPSLVQNPQAIGVLRHVQSSYIEERPGFHLCAFQIRRDVRYAGERGVRIVLFANAEELNRKHHLMTSGLRSQRSASAELRTSKRRYSSRRNCITEFGKKECIASYRQTIRQIKTPGRNRGSFIRRDALLLRAALSALLCALTGLLVRLLGLLVGLLLAAALLAATLAALLILLSALV
jgi:hypothetical protein